MLIGNIVGIEEIYAGKRHSAVIVAKPTVANEERKKAKRERMFKSMASSSAQSVGESFTGSDEDSLGSLDSLEKKRSPSKGRKKLTRKNMKSNVVAIVDDGESPGEHRDVYMWGYNAYGELGLGDTNIRLTPTLVTALQNARVRQLSLGDRHTLAITDHVPMLVKDVPDLKPYFEVLKVNVSRKLKNVLQGQISKLGYSGDLLDTPNIPYTNQPGYDDNEILNDRYEEGLRYCMDTIAQKPELSWRRKGLETCYECPPLGLKSVCMACARRCQKERLLVPRIRYCI